MQVFDVDADEFEPTVAGLVSCSSLDNRHIAMMSQILQTLLQLLSYLHPCQDVAVPK